MKSVVESIIKPVVESAIEPEVKSLVNPVVNSVVESVVKFWEHHTTRPWVLAGDAYLCPCYYALLVAPLLPPRPGRALLPVDII